MVGPGTKRTSARIPGVNGRLTLNLGFRLEKPGAYFETEDRLATFNPDADMSDRALTPAEVVVLRLIAVGNANKQIADQLAIKKDTVKGRVKRFLAKLDANDRTHPAIIGLKRGIIDL